MSELSIGDIAVIVNVTYAFIKNSIIMKNTDTLDIVENTLKNILINYPDVMDHANAVYGHFLENVFLERDDDEIEIFKKYEPIFMVAFVKGA